MGSCSAQDRKKLEKVVNVAQSITQTSLPSIDSVYTSRCLSKAAKLMTPPPRTFSLPPSSWHSLFHLLPSGKRYKSLRTRTNWLKNSFFPAAVRLLNGPTSHWVDLSLHPSYDCNTTFCTLSFPSLWTVCFVSIARKKQYFSLYVNTCDNNKSNQILSNKSNQIK